LTITASQHDPTAGMVAAGMLVAMGLGFFILVNGNMITRIMILTAILTVESL